MARPQKKNDERRDCVLPPLRCTCTERAIIQANAAQAGMSVSHYVRAGALSGDKIIVREPVADNRLVQALLAIGRNLNQLTKKAHIFGEYDAALLRAVLRKIDGLLDKLL